MDTDPSADPRTARNIPPTEKSAPAPELSRSGKALWDALHTDDMPQAQVAILTEACRARDRLDRLDALLQGDTDVWFSLVPDVNSDRTFEIRVTQALSQANATATTLRQLLAQLPAEAPKRKGTALDELAARRTGTSPARAKGGR